MYPCQCHGSIDLSQACLRQEQDKNEDSRRNHHDSKRKHEHIAVSLFTLK